MTLISALHLTYAGFTFGQLGLQLENGLVEIFLSMCGTCSHPLSSSSPSVSATATLAADAMWIGSPSHRCSAITYSDERSLNWLGPGMACSHALCWP